MALVPLPPYFGGNISPTSWRMDVKNSQNDVMNIKELLILTNEKLGVVLKVRFGFFRSTLGDEVSTRHSKSTPRLDRSHVHVTLN